MKTTQRTMNYNRKVGALYLTVAGKEYGYWFDRQGNGYYRLTAFVANQRPGEAGHYDLGLAARSCTCKGHKYHGKCKHADALAVLAARGDLS